MSIPRHHARAGTLAKLTDRFRGHGPVPNPGHLGGYDGDLLDKPGTEDEDRTIVWRDGNGAPAETRLERAVTAAAAAIDPAEEWYGYAGTTVFDNPPQHARRPYVPEPEPEPAPRPVIWPLPPELPRYTGPRAAQVVAMLRTVRYPGCLGTPEDYAATMAVWSRITGTRSALESPGAWPRAALGEVCEPADWPEAAPEVVPVAEPLAPLPGFCDESGVAA